MSSGPSCVNMPMATRNSDPERVSFMDRSRTCAFTPLNSAAAFCSRVNIFTSSDPLAESVSLIIWFISSVLACVRVAYFRRDLPAMRVGAMSSGNTASPTHASCQLKLNSATSVVTMVAILPTTRESVPEMTLLTPEMSVSMRVMMSPCFSVVKNECGMRCRCMYISLRMSKMMCCEIHALM